MHACAACVSDGYSEGVGHQYYSVFVSAFCCSVDFGVSSLNFAVLFDLELGFRF